MAGQREGEAVRNLPPDFQWFGASQNTGQWIVLAIALAVFVVVAWSMATSCRPRGLCSRLRSRGARLAGIRPRRRFLRLRLDGIAHGAGLFAPLDAFRHRRSQRGLGLELEVIAAVVVGGTAISGGRGT